ncbi:hypothetical protein Hanom_Chr10g00895971 [Helianthus anomalus]
MWVSVLKKRGRFQIGMGFEPAQVSARDGLRHETGFESERVQFKLSFGPRRVSARRRFWIETGFVIFILLNGLRLYFYGIYSCSFSFFYF